MKSKIKLTIILFLAALAISLSAVPSQAVIITLDVLDTDIFVGDSFDVVVYAQDDEALGELISFGFDVDPLASLISIRYDFATLDPNFVDLGSTDNYVAGGWDNPMEFNAGMNVALATLSFTALAEGTDSLDILGNFGPDFFDRGLIYDLGERNISASTDITVRAAAGPVPEPATVFLIVSGLFSMGIFGRKKFK